MANTISQNSYYKALTGLGVAVVVLGAILFFAHIKTLYDLPIILMIIGAWMTLQNGWRLTHPRAGAADIIINSKTLNNVLTNYAIIIAMVVLVLIICIMQPRFMQIRVVLDIMTQSSTKLIIALGICFTLVIAGCDY